MRIPVIEVCRGDDGVWEAYEAPVFGSDDLDVVDSLDDLPQERVWVRVAGDLKQLIVYKTDDDEGLVPMTEAYTVH
jgi:hypothetical protein